MLDMEVLRILAGAILVAPPDTGEPRILRLLKGGRETALSVMAEAEDAIANHIIHAKGEHGRAPSVRAIEVIAIHHAALHHKDGVLQHGDVFQWIALDGHRVCPLAGIE
jgi:hypothetical protein